MKSFITSIVRAFVHYSTSLCHSLVRHTNIELLPQYVHRTSALQKSKYIILLLITATSIVSCKSSYKTTTVKFTGPQYKVAVVDLMILKRQKLGAFALTKEIGADGLEVDMGGLGTRETFDNQLAKPEVRQQFLDKAKELNIEICSMSMSGFYAQSFPERPTAVKAVGDCIATMKAMNVKVGFLPLGVKGDLLKYPELRPAVVTRLKEVGKIAEKEDVVIGIETALSAKEELQLLNDVNSPAIKSYFNFSNALKNGRDVSEELKILGKKNIIQIHCTDDDGVWLQNNTRLDMNKVKATLDEMGWSGWLVIERSRDAKDPRNVKLNFSANTTYVKSIFQKAM